jgi:biuret amidohydrolase
LSGARTALLVIDPQVDFLTMARVGAAERALPAIARLLGRARAGDTPVVFTQELHRPQLVDFGRELDGDEPVHCVEGTAGAELVAELRPRQGELTVRKRRYSAFFATDLDLLLRGLGVDTVVACGFLTDVCVHYSCVDAHQLDLRVHVVPMACAGSSAAAESAAIAAIAYLQAGAVLELDAACAMLADQRSGASIARTGRPAARRA